MVFADQYCQYFIEFFAEADHRRFARFVVQILQSIDWDDDICWEIDAELIWYMASVMMWTPEPEYADDTNGHDDDEYADDTNDHDDDESDAQGNKVVSLSEIDYSPGVALYEERLNILTQRAQHQLIGPRLTYMKIWSGKMLNKV